MIKFSIAITSFNREVALKRQLDSIVMQNLEYVDEIIVIDNNSDFDVKELVDGYLNKKIKLIKNPANIGGCVNIIFPLLLCKTEWLWTLSDDDITLSTSIKSISDRLLTIPESVCAVKFGRLNVDNDEYHALSLNGLIDYYLDRRPNLSNGDLYFISTNVLRVSSLKNFLHYGFNYSTSGLGHLIPVFYAMENAKLTFYIACEKIVEYRLSNEDKWGHIKFFPEFSTISLLRLDLNNKYYNKFMDLMTVIPYNYALYYLILNYSRHNMNYFNISYYSIYKYNLSFFRRSAHHFIYHLLRIKYFRIFLLFYGTKIYKKII